MNKYDVNDWAFLTIIMSEVFADNDSIREKSYTEVLNYLCVSFKDLVTWSDQDLAKVEQFALNGGDLDTPIVEVLAESK